MRKIIIIEDEFYRPVDTGPVGLFFRLLLIIPAVLLTYSVIWGCFLLPFGVAWDWWLHLGWTDYLFGFGIIGLIIGRVGEAIINSL